MDSVKINKIVTIITDKKVFSFKRKSDFWNSEFLKKSNQLEIISSSNNNSVIKKLKALNFNIKIDNSFGFDWDIKITAIRK